MADLPQFRKHRAQKVRRRAAILLGESAERAPDSSFAEYVVDVQHIYIRGIALSLIFVFIHVFKPPVGVVLLVPFAALSLAVAVSPPSFDRWARKELQRTIDRLRSTGERNPYVGPDTDPDRFLKNLRVMAALAFVIATVIVCAYFWTR